jgi:hypothetical protein
MPRVWEDNCRAQVPATSLPRVGSFISRQNLGVLPTTATAAINIDSAVVEARQDFTYACLNHGAPIDTQKG